MNYDYDYDSEAEWEEPEEGEDLDSEEDNEGSDDGDRLLEARARQAAAPRRNQPAVQQQAVQPAVAPAPQVQVCNHPGR